MTKNTEVTDILDDIAGRIDAAASSNLFDKHLQRAMRDAAYLVRTIAEVPFRREGDAEALLTRIKHDATFIADNYRP